MKIYRIAKPNPLLGELVNIETGEVPLHGLLYESDNDTLCIFIHGTASNFYENDWVFNVAKHVLKNGCAFLTTNNRGAQALTVWPVMAGGALEKFSYCVDDIDEWINFAKKRKYSKIVLIGHSLGTEKLVHYMNHGSNTNSVIGIVLCSFSDSFGCEESYAKENLTTLLKEAKALVKAGKGDQFLTSDWLCHFDCLPKSATSYLDFFSDNSDLSKALPLRTGGVGKLEKIEVPILATISDGEEYTITPVNKIIEVIENKENARVAIIENSDHDYNGGEEKLAKIIASFVLEIN